MGAVSLPRPVHDADWSGLTADVGIDLTSVPNIGSNGTAFTTSGATAYAADTLNGIKVGLSAATDVLGLPVIIPRVGDYTILVALQPTFWGGNKVIFTEQDTSSTWDIFWQATGSIRHNALTAPTYGFDAADVSALGAAICLAGSYNATTQIFSVYKNGVLIGSGTVPNRTRTSIAATFFNYAVATAGNQGVAGKHMATKVWNVGLTALQIKKATDLVVRKYGVKWGRFSPTDAVPVIDCWGDSMFNTPTGTAPAKIPAQLAGLFTPSADVYAGGVDGQTSAQVRTRFEATTVRRNGINLFFCGRNNPSDPSAVIADHNAMIGGLDGPSKYIVCSPCLKTTEVSGTTFDQVTALRAAMSSQYATNYLDMQPTLFSAGNVGADDQHWSAQGATAAAALIKAKCQSLGYVS